MFARLTLGHITRRISHTRQCRRLLATDVLASNPARILRRVVATTTVLVSGTLFAFYYFDSRSAVHRYVFTPLLRHTLDPESSHKVAVKVIRSGLAPKDKGVDDERLRAELWGETLPNPIGLAAGFDKNGEAIDGLFDLGFSWVEIGSITPKPQPGNPKPRVFHLLEDSAIINRYGFPSDGAVSVLSRLRRRLPRLFPSSTTSQDEKAVILPEHASLRPKALLAINLGKNKSSPPDSPSDFLLGVRLFAPYADVLVINVSSPNTPGLRGMQSRGMLEELSSAMASEVDTQSKNLAGKRPRLVLKIAPDLTDADIEDIGEAVKAIPGIDGVIVSNTTIQRPSSLTSNENVFQQGGLSGPPLKPITLRVLRRLRSHLPPSMPIIGCGGISSGADALEYARNGASIVQLYTAFGYDGPGACRRIKDELKEALEREGTTWTEVVKHATEELSAKSVEIPESADADAKEKGSLKVLVDEALAIKRQLESLGEKMGEKAKDAVFESAPPPS